MSPALLPARSPRDLARLAGLLYLVIAITGGFAGMVRSRVFDPDAAARTAANVLANDGLFRFSIAGDLVAFSAEVALALVIFALFRPVSMPLALLAAFFRLAQGTASMINMGNQAEVLRILRGEALTGLAPDQAHALTQLALETHADGYRIALVFFGLHNIVLGALIVRSGAMPLLLGLLVMSIASTGYLVDSIGVLLVPNFPGWLSTAVLTPAVIVEIALIGWLLVKGVSLPRLNGPLPRGIASQDRRSNPARPAAG